MTIDELLAKYEPRFRDAFLAGVDEITSKARIKEITEALERGDVSSALDALYIEREAYAEFEATLEAAFGEGGAQALDELGTLRDPNQDRFVLRFNSRDLAAENWLRQHSSEMITRLVDDQRQAVRDALRGGLARGDNPRSTALNIVGRIDRRSQRRTGGIVGLSSAQQRAVSKARTELTDGDYGAYFSRARRDKRFDRIVLAARRDEKPLTKVQVDKILGRYSDRLLKLRGDTIARTETLVSLNRARYEAIRQLIATGKVSASQVSLMWDASNDARTRVDHLVADKQLVKWGEPFNVGGRRMLYPGDPNGGADQVINCRCTLRVKINFGSNTR